MAPSWMADSLQSGHATGMDTRKPGVPVPGDILFEEFFPLTKTWGQRTNLCSTPAVFYQVRSKSQEDLFLISFTNRDWVEHPLSGNLAPKC